MISENEIKKYLPHYLSIDSRKALLRELEDYPENIDGRIFTTYLKTEKTIFQGDGFNDFLFVNLPNPKIGKRPAMVISNTCDISKENERKIPNRVVYAPIWNLSKFEQVLLNSNNRKQSVRDYIEAIKRQEITDVFYLPQCNVLENDSLVKFDHLNNLPIDYMSNEEIEQKRLFTLSDFGFYIFLIKLSIHFTRVREAVKRSPETVST
ncbi:MAG: hypothetical protein ACQETR_10305 [Thermodesulfobacteriota bacterium]